VKQAIYKGGIFGEGKGEVLSCCLCGELNYEKLIVQRLGIAAGMSGDDYTFCEKCWYGKNLGKRLLQLLGYPVGMYLKIESIELIEIDNEK
jgi:hypothetical protein